MPGVVPRLVPVRRSAGDSSVSWLSRVIASALTACPHDGQNFAVPGTCAPQFRQAIEVGTGRPGGHYRLKGSRARGAADGPRDRDRSRPR